MTTTLHEQSAPSAQTNEAQRLIAILDAAADNLLDRLRGNPLVDRVMLTASHLGDWSLLWHIIGVSRAVLLRRPIEAVRLAALLGAESVIVNQGIKRLFRRSRPTVSGDPTLRVRQPSTSSFPSGHASAAVVAACALTSRQRRLGPIWWLLATLVGTSRAYVRIHHASDVVGGAVTGAFLWRIVGRRVMR
jgi:membrane-associated phospholipid phosphatase